MRLKTGPGAVDDDENGERSEAGGCLEPGQTQLSVPAQSLSRQQPPRRTSSEEALDVRYDDCAGFPDTEDDEDLAESRRPFLVGVSTDAQPCTEDIQLEAGWLQTWLAQLLALFQQLTDGKRKRTKSIGKPGISHCSYGK